MTAAPAHPIHHQRTRGTAEVGLAGGRLQRLFQQGSAKAIVLHPGPEVVFLNTAGGVTGGDELDYRLRTDASATATTQTAERAYRAAEDMARITVDLAIADGHLDWLPQETILFQRSALARKTRVALGREASCLVLEAVVLGRAAMGETVTEFTLSDRREITRGGRPVLVEPLMLTPKALQPPAALSGARAVASLALVAQGAEDALSPVRAVLSEPGVQGAASAFDGKLMVRLMAADGWPLRRQIARLLTVLRTRSMTTPLPRVWQI
ncbi:MAG: urease accessory protein UreD [Rhodobacter sp.]|nr:urease accessory protein UreD [Paracoccaceae bacterium]MCC0075266.1 urease accessory protein UreD [Rhodobacter sp.]